ncbi:uncharacterized protein BJ171DRAFT_543805 [Polychytrium aggregatum]|uniref:uncharacterized protein n=1 Tax=Polychytrium aggregatum TaxID=110093 RepID=UPI0022FEAE50|nr:uncharacterized protein BJ171DRAFT_543805 [Polychytrium aggregatum]KAI9190604.1 hypothetical protein BJ171DRAFT_543805 [Polychytrium aggregatum]
MEAALSLLYYLLSTDHGAVTTMLATPERSLQWDLEASDSVSPSMTLESALYHLFQVAHIVNRKEHVEAMQAPDIIPLTRIFEQCFSRDTSSATIFAPVSRQCMLPKHLSGWQLRSVGNELLSNVLLTLHQFPTLSYNSQVLLTSSILVIARQTSLCQKQSREAKTPLIDPYICNLICTLEMIHEKFTVYIIEDNILDVQAKMERIKSDIGSGPINSRQPTERQHSRKGDAPHLSALPTVRPSDLQSSETRQPPRPVVPTPSGRGRRSSFFVRRPPRTHENETKVLRSCLVLREFAVELSEVLFINQRASNFMPEDDSVDW